MIPPNALVLFDIDGTLLRRAGPHHRLALIAAIRRVTGMETTTDGVPVAGMLDPGIVDAMMRQAGAPRRLVRESLPAVMATAERIHVRTCPNLTRRVCPGVRRLLGRLRRAGVVTGLVTGNLTRIGWNKMRQAGLREFFRFGEFGETAPTRAGLVRNAVRRTKRTAPQAGLTNAKRRSNVSGVFRVRRPSVIQGRRVLLVDDVMTTGATASACARALKNAGAKRVALLTVARADRRLNSFAGRPDSESEENSVRSLAPYAASR